MKSVSKSFKMVALVAATTGMVLSSCGHESIYDPDYANKVLQQNWKEKMMDNNGEIDPNQDWSMAMVGNVTITSNEAGTMYLFNADPLNKSNNPSCIGKFRVNPSETISAKLDLQKGTQFIYAGLYTSEGALKVRPVLVEDGNVVVTFGELMTRADNGLQMHVDMPVLQWTPGVVATSKPSDAKQLPEKNGQSNVEYGKNYYVNSEYSKIDCSTSCNVYIEGTVNLSDVQAQGCSPAVSDAANHCKFYILPGANVTIGGVPNQGYEFYVAEGATLNFNTVNLFNCFVLNEGTINNENTLNLNNNTVFVNKGALNVNGTLLSANSSNQFWNEGDVKAKGFENQGSASLYNIGNVTIDGTTTINSHQDGWFNDGKWITNDMTVKSESYRWVNNCQLIVKNMFEVNLSNMGPDANRFLINGGGSVITKDLYLHTGSIVLGSKALLKVEGTAKVLYNEPANPYYEPMKNGTGIFGLGEEYAVLQMNKVVQEVVKANSVRYNGKLYVASDNHFAQGYDGGSGYYYQAPSVYMTGYDNAPISIEASECSPGYNFKSLPDPKPEPQTFIFACEDLGTSDDFDFNDVVFSVSHVAGETKAVVTVLAAGGTLDAYIVYDNSELGEVHSMLGAEAGMMTNTSEKGITHTHAGKEISVAGDWTLASNSDKFRVRVVNLEGNSSHSEYVEAPKEGEAPQMIILPSEWEWPTERTNIKDAYPDFIKWTKDATISDWNTKKVDSLVVKRK